MTIQKKIKKTMKTIQQLHNTSRLKMDDLTDAKVDLKKKIEEQQRIVQSSIKQLVPFSKDSTTINLNKKSMLPLSLITTPIRKGKAITMVEGIMIGYKLTKNIRRLLRR